MQVNNPAIHINIAKEVRKVSNSVKRCRSVVFHTVKFPRQDCTNVIKNIGKEIPKELNAFFVELKRL